MLTLRFAHSLHKGKSHRDSPLTSRLFWLRGTGREGLGAEKKTSVTYLIFKKLRNQTKLTIKNAKNAYYHLIFDNARSDREIWSQLRTLGLIRTLPLTISPEVLNIHFTDVCGTLTPTHPTELLDLPEIKTLILATLGTPMVSST